MNTKSRKEDFVFEVLLPVLTFLIGAVLLGSVKPTGLVMIMVIGSAVMAAFSSHRNSKRWNEPIKLNTLD